MKKIIFIRHGEIRSDYSLSDLGRRQMSRLGELLQAKRNGERIKIAASLSPRAKESAFEIAAKLDCDFEGFEAITADNKYGRNIEAAYLLICKLEQEADILILITNQEICETLPQTYAEKRKNISVDWYGVEMGEALIFDCEKNTLLPFSPFAN